MKKINLLLIFLMILNLSLVAQNNLKTDFEKSNFTKLTSYQEMINYLQELVQTSNQVKMDYIGSSISGKKIPILYFSENDFGNQRDTKPLLMVICQQHGNEPSGKEAALIVARQLINDKSYLLSKMDLALVPMVNIDGAEMGQRRNANNMDLNRNYVILSEPESQAVHELFMKWKPEITLDIHEFNAVTKQWISQGITKDAEEMLGGNSNLNIDENIMTFSKNIFIPAVGKKVIDADVRFHEYVVGSPFNNNRIRYSTTNINDGRQSFGIYNTLSFIIEGKRFGDIITNIERRTYGQQIAFLSFLETVAENSTEMMSIVKTARKKLLTENYVGSEIGIRMEYYKDQKNPVIDYPIFNLNNWHHELRQFKNFDALVKTIQSVTLPEAYVFSADETKLIELLQRHQIEFERTTKVRKAEIEQYFIKHVSKMIEEDKTVVFVDVKVIKKVAKIPKNSIVVKTKQAALKLIPLLLEPQSSWGFVSIGSGLQYRFTEYLQEGKMYPIERILKFKN